jgi:4-alpha-glucanotransferase
MAARTGSIPSTPVTPGKFTPFKRFTRVNLRFKLPFMTVWGQNLMIVGSDPIFGSWNIKQGIWMTPHHEGDVLVWQAFVSVPEAFDFEYRYCLVDEKLNVLKWEAPEKRKLAIPEGLSDGAVVDILDNWQVSLHLSLQDAFIDTCWMDARC